MMNKYFAKMVLFTTDFCVFDSEEDRAEWLKKEDFAIRQTATAEEIAFLICDGFVTEKDEDGVVWVFPECM